MACDIQIEKIIFKSKKTYIDEHHYHHDLLMICLSFSMPHWFHSLFLEALFVPVNFLQIKKNLDLPLTAHLENWRQSSLQCWEPQRPGTPHATGIFPPKIGKSSVADTSNTGDFFRNWGDSSVGFSEIPIKSPGPPGIFWCFVFFWCFFFFGSFFLGGCKFWLLRAPRLNLYWREVTVLPAGKHFAYQVASMPINLRSTVANVSTARPTISQRTCGFGTCLPKILGCLINMIIYSLDLPPSRLTVKNEGWLWFRT